MLDTLGSDTWSGVLIVINVETHSIQPIFSKGTYATHWDQTPNSRFYLWIMLQGTNSSWYFENAHAGHPGEALNFCFHSWQFSLMYIATRLMDRTEEELKCDKCDEMFRKKEPNCKTCWSLPCVYRLHLQVTERRRRHNGGCILGVTNVMKFSRKLFKLQNGSGFKASLHYVESSRLWFW